MNFMQLVEAIRLRFRKIFSRGAATDRTTNSPEEGSAIQQIENETKHQISYQRLSVGTQEFAVVDLGPYFIDSLTDATDSLLGTKSKLDDSSSNSLLSKLLATSAIESGLSSGHAFFATANPATLAQLKSGAVLSAVRGQGGQIISQAGFVSARGAFLANSAVMAVAVFSWLAVGSELRKIKSQLSKVIDTASELLRRDINRDFAKYETIANLAENLEREFQSTGRWSHDMASQLRSHRTEIGELRRAYERNAGLELAGESATLNRETAYVYRALYLATMDLQVSLARIFIFYHLYSNPHATELVSGQIGQFQNDLDGLMKAAADMKKDPKIARLREETRQKLDREESLGRRIRSLGNQEKRRAAKNEWKRSETLYDQVQKLCVDCENRWRSIQTPDNPALLIYRDGAPANSTTVLYNPQIDFKDRLR